MKKLPVFAPGRRHILEGLGASVAASALGVINPAFAARKKKVAMVVKAVGIPFFDACGKGGKEAAAEENVDYIYTGPTELTAEAQIEIIEGLIAQRVNAIAISADDYNALVPIGKKAMARGIKVISFDSSIASAGRLMNLNDAADAVVGERLVDMIGSAIGYQGQVAILAATAEATNQNIWINEAKKTWQNDPKYKGMTLVTTVYGDDQADKSYREALALFKRFPNLKGIIAPGSVGCGAAAKAVTDAGLTGKVFVTGLGLPSQMKPFVDSGVTKSFTVWNPIDLGYAAMMICIALAEGTATGQPGDVIKIGRLGQLTVGADGQANMNPPTVFDSSNIDHYAQIF